MSKHRFSPLVLDEWKMTRDMLSGYAKVLGKIRRALSAPQKHWWHVSLLPDVTGLATGGMPAGAQTVGLTLDLVKHEVQLVTSGGGRAAVPLTGQPIVVLYDQLMGLLAHFGVAVEVDREQFEGLATLAYDPQAATNYWRILTQIDGLLKQFKGEQREETSPVQLWAHHFDLSMVWFSGQLIPDQDPDDPEWSDEQMNFGFATGDDTVADAYFYITAYPIPEGWLSIELPAGGYWLTKGFKGAVLPYAHLLEAANPAADLLNFWRTVQKAGSALMKKES